MTLAVFPKGRSAKRKTPKGGTKGAFEPGRTRGLGRVRENLPQRRRCRKRHRWPVSETQPESEEARPVAEANEWPKAVADLLLSGQDAELNHRRVLTWFAGRWRNHQSKRAEKPHSKFSVARHWTALLRGRKLRLPWRIASGSRQPPARAMRLMSAREREHGELPSPTFVPVGAASAELAGTFVFLE